jgi:tripartite-type tricarboxylate transporter receptor subunit TctC
MAVPARRERAAGRSGCFVVTTSCRLIARRGLGRVFFFANLLALISGIVCASTVLAQGGYPNRPLRLVVPFAAGGSADVIARVIAQKVGEELGQSVVIENRAGANSNIGAEIVANANADGYTALYNTSSIIFNTFIYPKLGYDTFRDFAPVSLTAVVPQVLVVIPSLPVRSLQEFIAHVRANPGRLNYASVGHGNIGHLTTSLFLSMNKLDAVHVPYKGSQVAYSDLLGGRTQFYFATVVSAVPYIRDNRLRPIAVTSLTRSSALPDVPTMNESGMPKFEAGAWSGILVPAKTPPAVVKTLNAAVVKALKDATVRAQLERQGTLALGTSSEEYRRYLRSEHDRWGRIIREIDVK